MGNGLLTAAPRYLLKLLRHLQPQALLSMQLGNRGGQLSLDLKDKG